jgi:hypothetical protein
MDKSDWASRIPGCFGLDRAFAGNPGDQSRAFELLTMLRLERVEWRDVQSRVRNYLAGEGCGEDHINCQMEEVTADFRPWLAG